MTVLRSGSATHVGHVRSVNEDFALEGDALFAVADGMGGHAGGEVAARTAISSLERRFAQDSSANGLLEAVHAANRAVWERGRSDSSLRGMGTTLTAVALVSTDDGDRLAVANVGDSRAYRLHNGRLGQLTVDHSVAEDLVSRGELSEEEAAVHPQRHILTRALGVDPDVVVDTWMIVPEQGDRFLLCSDGLSNDVPPDDMSRALAAAHDPKDAAETLVRIANEAGGNDNVTAVVLDVLVGEPGTGDASETAHNGALPTGAVSSPKPTAGGLMGRSEETAPGVTRSQPATGLLPAQKRTGPRRVTFRVVLFVLVLGGLGYCAWAAINWYVNNSYFVGVSHGQVVIYKGRIGGFLGIDPKVVVRTGVTLSEIRATNVGRTQVAPSLQAGVVEPSRQEAIDYVCQIPALAYNMIAPRGVHCPAKTVPTTAAEAAHVGVLSPRTAA